MGRYLGPETGSSIDCRCKRWTRARSSQAQQASKTKCFSFIIVPLNAGSLKLKDMQLETRAADNGSCAQVALFAVVASGCTPAAAVPTPDHHHHLHTADIHCIRFRAS